MPQPQFLLTSDLRMGTVRAMIDWAFAVTAHDLIGRNQPPSQRITDLNDVLQVLISSPLRSRDIARTGSVRVESGKQVQLPLNWTIAIAEMNAAGLSRIPVFTRYDLQKLNFLSPLRAADTAPLTPGQAKWVGDVLEGYGYELTTDPSKVDGTRASRSSDVPARQDNPAETNQIYALVSEPLGDRSSHDLIAAAAEQLVGGGDAPGHGGPDDPNGPDDNDRQDHPADHGGNAGGDHPGTATGAGENR